MLVLSRKQDQEIHVPDYGIKFKVLGVEGNRVRIGIDAPNEVRVIRSELSCEAKERDANSSSSNRFDHGYVWPLGVRFEPHQSTCLPKNRIQNRFSKHFKRRCSTESSGYATSQST